VPKAEQATPSSAGPPGPPTAAGPPAPAGAAGPPAPAGPFAPASARRLSGRRLRSLIRKEFIEIRRDPRTLALIVAVPVMLLVIFGYAATFDIHHIPTELVANNSSTVRARLDTHGDFTVSKSIAPSVVAAKSDILHGRVSVAIVVSRVGRPTEVLVDGSDLLTAMTAERELSALENAGRAAEPEVDVLYNPTLRSTTFMVPGLIGIIMVQVALVLTALGVVRERERGTIEQLMITPLSKLELMIGKTVPYLLVSLADLCFVLLIGWLLFGVPIRGSLTLLFGEALLFLTATLGMGLVISTIAQTQLQAMQMSVFVQLPQMLLSGLIFPVASMPWGVRWLSYVLPLTYFASVARGIMLKGAGVGDLWPETVVLAGMAVVFVGVAALRFKKTLD